MRILEVIHGYPPRYNAGSEIYTQLVSEAFSRNGHDVAVFCRQENPYVEEFGLNIEENNGLRLYVVNHCSSKDKFKTEAIEDKFRQVMDAEMPDVVHIGHLNHLSTGIPSISKQKGAAVVYTLHDYWLACPRGQFLQTAPDNLGNWPHCPGQEDERCAERCYSRMHTGTADMRLLDISYWTAWINSRMNEIRKQLDNIDILVSPSLHLLARVSLELNLKPSKIVLERYGFDHSRLEGRKRSTEQHTVFGYIGRIVPAKGVNNLIEAFSAVSKKAKLRIWGAPSFPDDIALKKIIDSMPPDKAADVEWAGPYSNREIVQTVLNNVDVIVVPSIWDENSPLVIQEALHARIPVICPDKGGMAELVNNGVNGLTFHHRDVNDLAAKMQIAVDSPEYVSMLGMRGNLYSEDGRAHSIENHVRFLEGVFCSILEKGRMEKGVNASEAGNSIAGTQETFIDSSQVAGGHGCK